MVMDENKRSLKLVGILDDGTIVLPGRAGQVDGYALGAPQIIKIAGATISEGRLEREVSRKQVCDANAYALSAPYIIRTPKKGATKRNFATVAIRDRDLTDLRDIAEMVLAAQYYKIEI